MNVLEKGMPTMSKEKTVLRVQFDRFGKHVTDRNLRDMLKMVELGHNVNMAKPWSSFDGAPILVELVTHKDWRSVLFLLKHRKQLNLDVNARSRTGYHWTSLHYAVSSAHLPTVDALIENGADFNCKSRKQMWTPLEVLFENNKAYRQPRTIKPKNIFKRQAAVFERLIIAGAVITNKMLAWYSMPRTWSEHLRRQINGCKHLRAILDELFEDEVYITKLLVEFVFSKTIERFLGIQPLNQTALYQKVT